MRRVAPKFLATCVGYALPELRAEARRGALSLGWLLALSFAAVILAAAPAVAQEPLAPEGQDSGMQAPSAQAFPKTPGGMFGAKPKLDKTQPLHLQADQLVYDTKGNKVIARGNVEIFYNNNVLRADEVVYDQGANTLSASGNVRLQDGNGNTSRADRMDITADFRDGFVDSLTVVAKDESKITADRAVRREGNVTEFTNGRYTACKPKPGDPPFWCIGARKIIHDQTAQTISYQDATFELFGVPVFYLPYFQHADPTVKRKSGFLIPTYGSSNDLGTFTSVPYFFNLAPNYDLLFHPTYLTKQGVLWQADWRHRLENGQYNIKLAGIEQDSDDLPDNFTDESRRNKLDGWRGSVETKGEFSFGSWWNAGWDLTFDSDDSFRRFYKLDSILHTERVNRVYLEGISDRNYLGMNIYELRGLNGLDSDQADAIVHPVIDHNYIFSQPLLGGELSLANNAYSLSRDDADNVSNTQNITKLTSEVKWRRRLTDGLGISYTPFGELRGDVYQLNDYFDPVATELESSDTVTRGVATAGATISYPWVANTANASHIIEPIGQVVTRRASVTQDRLPNEDAKSLVFDDTNLFDADKFSGYDRIETGTRANVGLQYTFQSNNGGYARILAGQSFHLGGDNAYNNPGLDPEDVPVFSPVSGLQENRSDYVLGFYVAPTDVFRVIAQSRFDESSLDLRRADISARFSYGPIVTQATYSYQDSTLYFDRTLGELAENRLAIDQQDIVGSAGLRLSDRWTVFAAMRYDLDDGERLTDSIQLRYGDECFAISLTYNETFIIDPDREIEPDQTVMLRFEFKNLGEYKYKTDVLDHTNSTDDQPGLQ